MELLILAHAPVRVLEQGFLPAAAGLGLDVTILTDNVGAHLARAQGSAHYGRCGLAECDVFNPLAVLRHLAIHGGRLAGVLATDAALRAPAAIVAAALGLPGPNWRVALQREQRTVDDAQRRIVDVTESLPELPAAMFPVSVLPLEAPLATGGVVAGDLAALRDAVAALGHGYAVIEACRADEELYALDLLATLDGTALLCGSRIALDADSVRTKRVQAFMPRPPRCDELLALLAPLELGLGRHHVEYGISPACLRIRELHNGLHDDESELALDDQLDGDLFAATVRTAVGLPAAPLHLLRTGAAAAALEAAA